VAGATCQINFVKDGQTKTLTPKLTDSSGKAIWDWDVKNAGFSSGIWKISAVAILNGQSKTAYDGIPLEIN